jgi:NAD(P)H-dependent flavin oxidoreductase YrpB (nitropropane dioxygenase family)
MIKTKATELLGIDHPIVCGGMTATGSAELAAGVSNSGCLGMLTCLHCKTPERLNLEIQRLRTMTTKPFGVNLTILGEKRGAPEYPAEFCKVICANNIKIVETCGSNKKIMIQLHKQLRNGGVEVIISKCVAVKHALSAQNNLGCDMISLMGFDSGGLPGEADTGIFVQCALAKKKLNIPFLLSGGVANGTQLLAALTLGAAGVQIGTRFNATVECNKFAPSFKKRMVDAGVKDTVMVMASFNASSRVLKNKDAIEILRIESEKGGKAGVLSGKLRFQDIGKYAMFDRLLEGMDKGDPDMGIWNCGQSVALIEDIITCQEFVDRLILEAEDAMKSVQLMFQTVSKM